MYILLLQSTHGLFDYYSLSTYLCITLYLGSKKMYLFAHVANYLILIMMGQNKNSEIFLQSIGYYIVN